jgi:hypothetical protein
MVRKAKYMVMSCEQEHSHNIKKADKSNENGTYFKYLGAALKNKNFTN